MRLTTFIKNKMKFIEGELVYGIALSKYEFSLVVDYGKVKFTLDANDQAIEVDAYYLSSRNHLGVSVDAPNSMGIFIFHEFISIRTGDYPEGIILIDITNLKSLEFAVRDVAKEKEIVVLSDKMTNKKVILDLIESYF